MNAAQQRRLASWNHRSPDNDAEATVVHAGRRVPVVIMGTMSGMQRRGITGEDVLCRAQAGGCYYLVRETYRSPPHPRQPHVRLPSRLRRRWVRVHRLTVRAGLLLALLMGSIAHDAPGSRHAVEGGCSLSQTRFRRSDKVVCINAQGFSPKDFLPLPETGRVYVVRRATPMGKYPQALALVGIHSRVALDGSYHLLGGERFRLLSEVQAENPKRTP